MTNHDDFPREEDPQTVSDEEALRVSARLIERNRQAYEVLAE